ncbi:MaoC/PaaZ C-terminal domain-containing protein [Streptomyces sp. NPDC006172]|uniref:MaoC/PaaZ C-terminal domain-containing protein n=1 Tax=Streptomyces sp. NPDC006172 TaxID=3154470 RepID=UPI0033C9C1AD
MTSVSLPSPPALAPLLARGALLSPLKRPRPDAGHPRVRLVLPRLRIDQTRLTAYERVCGFGAGEDTLPVTYPHVLGFPLAMRLMSDRRFPLPLLGLVHTSIEITRHRPLPVAGAYELAVHVDRLTPHRRGTEATVVTEARDGGELVWESHSTYLARHGTSGAASPEAVSSGPASPGAASPGAATPGAASPGTVLSRVGVGDGAGAPLADEGRLPLPVLDEWRLAADIGRRYGTASGDRNPIHLHPLTARLFGFPRAIAHGMWTAARCLAAHGTPEAVRVRADFRAPVLLPGTVTFAADGTRFELRGPGDEGRLHVSGRVEALA